MPPVSSAHHPSKKRSAATTVYLVGAGPGDPGLLTLRGAEVLSRADVVLYDGLSNQAILAHAPSAEHICVGKHGQTRLWTQEEINAEILAQAARGRCVVRLKGGDPAVFARTAEEVAAIRGAGLGLEIVPGITAALAAGSFAGIPITHRAVASAVALVTGHEEPSKSESALDWSALARFPGTLVIYMGVTTVGVWTSALMDAGKSAATPAAILRRCSLPDQQIVRCRLDEVAAQLTPATKMRPPVIVIVGPVADLPGGHDWFGDRPLFGRRIVVSRAAREIDSLGLALRERGAEVLHQPAIAIEPAADQASLRSMLRQLDQFDWIVFTSSNGVDHFFDGLALLHLDARALAGVKLAAVGVATEATLQRRGLMADLVPSIPNAEGLIDAFPTSSRLSVLWARASRGPDTLATGLRQHGHQVTEVIAYQHRDVTTPDPTIVEHYRAGAIDWTTVTSSAIARSLVTMFGSPLASSKIASLSPKTSQTLRQLGIEPATEAATATMESLAEAIAAHEATHRST
jgi:uroporphyrinogen III methyltransferase/synthase